VCPVLIVLCTCVILLLYATGQCSDEGRSFVSEIPHSPAATAFKHIISGPYSVLLCTAFVLLTLIVITPLDNINDAGNTR